MTPWHTVRPATATIMVEMKTLLHPFYARSYEMKPTQLLTCGTKAWCFAWSLPTRLNTPGLEALSPLSSCLTLKELTAIRVIMKNQPHAGRIFSTQIRSNCLLVT